MLSDLFALLRLWMLLSMVVLAAARGVAPFGPSLAEVEPDGARPKDACILLGSQPNAETTRQRVGFGFADHELAYAGSYDLCAAPLPDK